LSRSEASPSHDQRRDLYDFVLAELHQRVPAAGPILRKITTLLANHRDDLLAFAQELDEAAAAFEVSPALAREVLHQLEANPDHSEYWPHEADLHRRSHGRRHELRAAIAQVRHLPPRHDRGTTLQSHHHRSWATHVSEQCYPCLRSVHTGIVIGNRNDPCPIRTYGEETCAKPHAVAGISSIVFVQSTANRNIFPAHWELLSTSHV